MSTPCTICKHTPIGSVTVKEQVASSWFEYDDDGYPTERFGDRMVTWEKGYAVCEECGTIWSFDGYSWYPDNDVPQWIQRKAKHVLEVKAHDNN